MRTAAAALLLTAVSAFAQGPAERASRLILDASRALQAGSDPRFLGYFDKKSTPQFAQLREGVTALLAVNKVASSVEAVPTAVRTDEVDFEIDWLLQIASERDVSLIEQRRETVRATVRVSPEGEAKLIRIEPVEFFAPAPLRPNAR